MARVRLLPFLLICSWFCIGEPLRVFLSGAESEGDAGGIVHFVEQSLSAGNVLASYKYHAGNADSELSFVRDTVIPNKGSEAVLVIRPVSKDNDAAVQLAAASKIPIFFIETRAGSAVPGVALLTPNNKKAGGDVAEEFCEVSGTAPTKIVALLTNDAACAARKDGFREKLERLCPKRAAEIAFTATLSGTRGAAQEYMTDIFVVDDAVDSVFSCNDAMALGAVDAAVEVRDEGKRGLMISGIGNTEEGRKAVMSSELYVTVDLLKADFGDTVFKFLVTWAEDADVVAENTDITTATRAVVSDPGSRIRKRIFKAYNKYAVPFLHRTLAERETEKEKASFLQTSKSSNDTISQNDCTGPVCPVIVRQKISINALMDVSPMDSNFKLLVYWKFKWVDERLYYMPEELDDSAIPLSYLEVKKDQVWLPDFTSTEGEFEVLRDSTRVRPLGQIEYAMAARLTASASFDLRMFPFDTQHLPLSIQSLSFGRDMYSFAKVPRESFRLTPTVAGVWKWRKPFFSLNRTEEKVGSTVYEKIFITFHLERDTRSYYLNYILPLNMINLVTYSALFLDPSQDDSLDIVLTTMLTVIAYMYILAGEVPKTPYMTWLGLFVMQAVLLVFVGALEVIILRVMCDAHAASPDKYDLVNEEEESDATFAFTESVPPRVRSLRRKSRVWWLVLFMLSNASMFIWAAASWAASAPSEDA